MRRKIKVGMIVGMVLCLLAGVLLTVNYVCNERMIKRFEEKDYSFNIMSALGITEPCIAPYNEGNVYFAKKNYKQAIRCYETALSKNPSEPKDCEIRINLALAMTLPIQPETVNDSNRKEIIKTLDDAILILTENSCADHESKSGKTVKGHSKTATELKEDIERLKKELMKDDTPEKDQSNDSDKDSEEKEKDKDQKKDQELTDQLKEIQNNSQQDRTSSLNQQYMDEDDWYTGKTW